MATQRQIDANRRNARNSTGPTSVEGKERSRGNALKHGGAGEGVVLRDVDSAKKAHRLTAWRSGYVIRTEEDEYLFEQLVTASVQVEVCQAQAAAIRSDAAARAETCWDEDRRDEVEKRAAGLSRRPSVIVHELLCTRHGCEWLIDQWRKFLGALESGVEFGPKLIALAFDLTGTPHEFRHASPCDPGQTPVDLAKAEIAALEQLLEGNTEADEHRRELAAAGFDPEPSRELNRLARYEAACFRKYQWARNQLERQTAPAVAPPQPVAPQPPPSPAPKPAPTPPPAPPVIRTVAAFPVPTPQPAPQAAPRRMTDAEIREAARRAAKLNGR